jgi:23S rRNA (uracil1939-C5)-methyltransferase
MRNKKKDFILENVPVIDLGAEGKSVCKPDQKVIFVKNAVPGDVVDLRVYRNKSSFAEAEAIHFHKLSEFRSKPACAHFGVCGGCSRQDLQYEQQLFYKQKQVRDNFSRIGKFDFPEPLPIVGADPVYHYRNKLEFTFSASRWITDDEMKAGIFPEDKRALGFHIPGKFDKILDIDKCYLQDTLSDKIRTAVRDFALKQDYTFFHLREQTGFLRTLLVRNTRAGDWMVVPVFFYEDKDKREALLDMLSAEFPQISSLMYCINSKKNDSLQDQEIVLYKGNAWLEEKMDDLKFRISPKSFFQTNAAQGEKLYRITREYAELYGTETVYDLYTGTGTIACYVAPHAAKVVGVEYVEAAVEDARINSEINGLQNTTFFAGDMKDVLNPQFVQENGTPQVIITDPPRAGMHEDVIQRILEIQPERIVYVSCNPATQARDISLMNTLYSVEKVQPVDMFPHTHHVENIALLVRRKSM